MRRIHTFTGVHAITTDIFSAIYKYFCSIYRWHISIEIDRGARENCFYIPGIPSLLLCTLLRIAPPKGLPRSHPISRLKLCSLPLRGREQTGSLPILSLILAPFPTCDRRWRLSLVISTHPLHIRQKKIFRSSAHCGFDQQKICLGKTVCSSVLVCMMVDRSRCGIPIRSSGVYSDSGTVAKCSEIMTAIDRRAELLNRSVATGQLSRVTLLLYYYSKERLPLLSGDKIIVNRQIHGAISPFRKTALSHNWVKALMCLAILNGLLTGCRIINTKPRSPNTTCNTTRLSVLPTNLRTRCLVPLQLPKTGQHPNRVLQIETRRFVEILAFAP